MKAYPRRVASRLLALVFTYGARSVRLHPKKCLAGLFLTAMICGRSDTFVYDAAGRLQSSIQSNGLTVAYTHDEEGNLLSASHTATDTTDSGGPGNNLPDWWEYYYFGVRGVDPAATPAGDGVTILMKFALGQNPFTPSNHANLAFTFQSFTDGNRYPYVVFVRSKEGASLLNVEQSTNLVDWQSGGAYFNQLSQEDLGDGTEKVTFRSLISQGLAPRIFFRLKVSDGSP